MNNKLSIKDKLNILLKPSNLIKLVLVQQTELDRLDRKKTIRANDTKFIEYLYEHYIIQLKPKTYLT